MRKQRRTKAQKAATRKMIAGNRKKSRKGKRKRSTVLRKRK